MRAILLLKIRNYRDRAYPGAKKMKAAISESIQFTGSDRVTISQHDKFEGTTVDIRIHDRAEAIRLATYLLQWAENQDD